MNDKLPEGSPWTTQLELNKQVIEAVTSLAAGMREVAEVTQALSDRLLALESKKCGCKKQVEI